MKYVKEFFEPLTFDHAKEVVLTSHGDKGKFERETTFMMEQISPWIKPSDLVLDFGCGMGRISREVVRLGCRVIGVDFSERMRTFAMLYCASQNFTPVPSYSEPNSIDVGLCFLVLQHVEHPKEEIENLVRVLKPGGKLILLNERDRLVPSGITDDGYVIWHNDKFDIFDEIEKHLTPVHRVTYLDPRHEVIFYQKGLENGHQ